MFRNINAEHWDHPREYGENLFIVLFLWVLLGPSPRIRGEFLRD